MREFRGYLSLQRGLSPHTVAAYTDDVKKLLDYLLDEHVQLREVTYEMLENFAAALYDLGIAVASRKRVLCGIKTFFRFLRTAGFIEQIGRAHV